MVCGAAFPYLEQRCERRLRAFLLDEDRRVDLARRVVHRHHQIDSERHDVAPELTLAAAAGLPAQATVLSRPMFRSSSTHGEPAAAALRRRTRQGACISRRHARGSARTARGRALCGGRHADQRHAGKGGHVSKACSRCQRATALGPLEAWPGGAGAGVATASLDRPCARRQEAAEPQNQTARGLRPRHVRRQLRHRRHRPSLPPIVGPIRGGQTACYQNRTTCKATHSPSVLSAAVAAAAF